MTRFNAAPKVTSTAAKLAIAGIGLHLVSRNNRLKQELETTKQEHQKQQEQLHYNATHDSLTGLLNVQGLNGLLSTSRPPKAILYVDGTNQKAVNDKLDHDRGDAAIKGTAKVITNGLRPNDIAARVGGDEFLVLLSPDRRGLSYQAEEEPINPDELLSTVTERIQLGTQDFLKDNPDLVQMGFDIAVGGAVWQEGMSVDNLRLAAEANMKSHKAEQHQVVGQHRPS